MFCIYCVGKCTWLHFTSAFIHIRFHVLFWHLIGSNIHFRYCLLFWSSSGRVCVGVGPCGGERLSSVCVWPQPDTHTVLLLTHTHTLNSNFVCVSINPPSWIWTRPLLFPPSSSPSSPFISPPRCSVRSPTPRPPLPRASSPKSATEMTSPRPELWPRRDQNLRLRTHTWR